MLEDVVRLLESLIEFRREIFREKRNIADKHFMGDYNDLVFSMLIQFHPRNFKTKKLLTNSSTTYYFCYFFFKF